jgi:hypothetical protein
MKPRYFLASVMLALIPMACATTRDNAGKKTVRNSALIQCTTADRCEAANG